MVNLAIPVESVLTSYSVSHPAAAGSGRERTREPTLYRRAALLVHATVGVSCRVRGPVPMSDEDDTASPLSAAQAWPLHHRLRRPVGRVCRHLALPPKTP